MGRSAAIVELLQNSLSIPGVAAHAAAGYVQLAENSQSVLAWDTATVPTEGPDVFDLASISKSFLAVLVAHMVEEARCTWTTELQSLAPELRGTWAGAQSLTALLSHRAGLRAHLELFRSSWGGGPVDRWALLRQAANARKSDLSPVYSDLGYLLVGQALAQHTEKALDTLLYDLVCGPWQVSVGSARQWSTWTVSWPQNASPTEVQPGRGGRLLGQVHDDNAWALDGLGFAGHAGLFGTLEATLRFGVRCLQEASAGRFAELLAPRPGSSLRLGFDSPSGPNSTAGKLASSDSFGHLGFTGTSLWCDPERRRVVALLSNRVFPSRARPLLPAVRTKIHDFLWSC